MPATERRRARLRLLWSGLVSGVLVAAVLAVPAYDDPPEDAPASLAWALEARKAALGIPHEDPPGMPPHVHNDPATKNEVSRAGDLGELTRDPTTAAQRRAGAAHVARERTLPEPRLRRVRPTPRRTPVPRTRYAMANGCYSLAGHPIYFKPTALGTYLLYDKDRRFVVADGRAAEPGPRAEWTVTKQGKRFVFTNGGRRLRSKGTSAFALRTTRGCARYPEAQVDVAGRPFAGTTPFQEVRGYVDAHNHTVAFEFLGGQVHCGRPWHKYGAPYALVDCPDHSLTGGYGGVLESFMSGEVGHDPVGWPTFKDWPAPNSLTHEGTYYRWLERAWRAGQRLMVTLLVENNKLCEIYPLKRNSCDDMTSVRLQAKRMRQLQNYIDAQAGGPGRGFLRIVRNPFEARRVINQGKMAVVLGMETSVPFGCTFKAVLGTDMPACSRRDIARQLDELKRLGVRQVEIVNKFDNALSGVAGDQGALGVIVNNAQFLETLSYWDMRHCEPADGESHDKNQVAFPEIVADQQDALFGAIGKLFGTLGNALPVYPPPAHCNSRGLTSLGEFTIKGLVDRKMIFDPDHMSVRARRTALTQIERLGYSGVVSSHSWATPDAYPRIYRSGGFITPMAGDSTGFVDKWRRHLGWADPRYYFGFGFGADINGLASQGEPRGAGARNKVRYPFTGLGGVTVRKQRAGKRVYDINVDGVAQFGLYPDWIEDLRRVAGRDGDKIVADMSRGPEAYLQMWERAEGVAPDSCRNPRLRLTARAFQRKVRRGMGTTAVLRAVGQPFRRLGTEFGYCVKQGDDPRAWAVVDLTPGGTVRGVRVRS